MVSSFKLNKTDAYETNVGESHKMKDDNIRKEDNTWLKNENVEKDHPKVHENNVTEDRKTEPKNCYRILAILFAFGMIAIVIFLLCNILLESKSQSRVESSSKEYVPRSVNNRYYYGTRGGYYKSGIGGIYFTKGFGAIYLANQAVGSRLGDSGTGGRGRSGSWGGRGRGWECFEENSFVLTKI